MSDTKAGLGRIDPQARRLMAVLQAGEVRDPAGLSVEQRRASFAALMRLAGRGRADVGVTETSVAGAAGDLPARLYAVEGGGADPRPGLVYFHGGGLVAGGLDTHDALCRNLAAGSGCRVVAIGYRLAPEHRFPAAVEDACAATANVLDRAGEFTLDPRRIGIGGDSAGATLATVAARTLTSRPGSRLACQLLLCPVLDIEGRMPSRLAFGQGYLLDAALMRRDLADYAPGLHDVSDPRLSPLRAADLSGLPRSLIHTAEFDPLRDEGRAYAERLEKAGVRVDWRCHAGMIHHFYGLTGLIPAAATALAEIARGLGDALAA